MIHRMNREELLRAAGLTLPVVPVEARWKHSDYSGRLCCVVAIGGRYCGHTVYDGPMLCWGGVELPVVVKPVDPGEAAFFGVLLDQAVFA